ncbi:MAG: DUF1189 family protein [Lachnospiraceae bacterium]
MDNQKDEKKMTMADRFMIAMFSPKEYEKILCEKTDKLVCFLILLILLFTMVRYVIPGAAILTGMGGIKGIVTREIPDFSLENGEFAVGERIEKDDEMTGVYVLVDTSVEIFSEADVPANVMEAVLVSKTNMLVYNEYSPYGGKSQEMRFSDLKDITLNNNILAQMAPAIYCLLFTFLLALYFSELIKYLLWGLFFAIFFTLAANVWMHPVEFGKAYKTSMYAQVIGTLVYSIACGFGNAMFMFAGNFFQIFVSFSIMRKVLIPIKRFPFNGE